MQNTCPPSHHLSDLSGIEPIPIGSDCDNKLQDEQVNILEALEETCLRQTELDSNSLSPTPIGPYGLDKVVNQVYLTDFDWYPNNVVIENLQTLFGKRKVCEASVSPCKKLETCFSKLPEEATQCATENLTSLEASYKADQTKSCLPCKILDPLDSSFVTKPQQAEVSASVSRRYSKSPRSSEAQVRCKQHNKWKEHFQDLLKFREVYGHCLVPNNWKENVRLARWVKRQRYQYKLEKDKSGTRSTTAKERIAALDRIGFIWESHAVAWEERFNDLRAYKKIYGHCNVPSTCAIYPGLALWVKAQRRQYRRFVAGKQSKTFQERIERLSMLGFECNPRNMNLSLNSIRP